VKRSGLPSFFDPREDFVDAFIVVKRRLHRSHSAAADRVGLFALRESTTRSCPEAQIRKTYLAAIYIRGQRSGKRE